MARHRLLFLVNSLPAAGGAAELIVKSEGTEMLHLPQLLPGGRAVLSTSTASLGQDRWNQAEIVAHSLTTGERTLLVKGGYHARYASSGHLLYVQRGTLYGVGFDASRLAVTTAAVPLVQDLAAPPGVGAVGATYSLADNGSLAYVRGVKRTCGYNFIFADGKSRDAAAVEVTRSHFRARRASSWKTWRAASSSTALPERAASRSVTTTRPCSLPSSVACAIVCRCIRSISRRR